MQKITPFLWFDGRAEEAARFYTGIFKNSRIVRIHNLEKAGQNRDQTVKSVTFELEGQAFHALDGGPQFTFSPAISLYVDCETQEELDHYWNSLVADGGQPIQCGWLADKFGISWQIIPRVLTDLLYGPDKARGARAFEAMLNMVKLDIATLESA